MYEFFYVLQKKTFSPSPKSKSQNNDKTQVDRAPIGQEQNSKRLHHFFETCAYNTPEATAIICGELALTYSDLENKANQLASYICSLKSVEERLCAIYLERSELPIISMLAVLKAGLGYVPIDPHYPRDRVLDILNDSGVGLLIAEQSLWSNIDSSYHKHVILVDTEAESISQQPEGRVNLDREIESNDLCYIIYTSGSSGRPKGVMIEHQSVVNYVCAINQLYKVDRYDHVYQGFSHAFDAAVEEIWVTLCFGATLIIGTGDIVRSAQDVARLINEWKVTVFSTIPTFLSMIEDDLSSVRLLIVGGEECLTELVNRWSTKTRQFFNTYGPTETTVVATATECLPNEPITIGKALQGYETFVLDEKLRRLPPGELGELCIGGISLARGYLNRPELTQEKFIANPFLGDGSSSPRLYRTGDLVSITSEGNLKFHGRIDSQIKIRGHRVELSEIEEVMLEHSDVKNAVVNVVKVDGVQKIAAYMVPQVTPKEVDRQAIFLNLRRKLPTYMMPSFLDCLRIFPVLPSGKVDRKTLPSPVEPLISRERKIVAADTESEKILVRVCTELIGNPEISIEDDFFFGSGRAFSVGCTPGLCIT
jgi:amino acid adenylation domain-containing protein